MQEKSKNVGPSSREKPNYEVYVLRSLATGKLYIGYSSDVDRRMKEHKAGKSTWTRGKGPWQLIHREGYRDKSDASSREEYLKSGWGRRWLKKKDAIETVRSH